MDGKKRWENITIITIEISNRKSIKSINLKDESLSILLKLVSRKV